MKTQLLAATLSTALCSAHLTGCADKSHVSMTPIQQRIVEAAGADQFHRFEQVAFTFNVIRPEGDIKRSFDWNTRTNVVTYTEPGKEPVTYDHDEITKDSPADLRKIDGRFINDGFWFLLPVHLSWSSDVMVEDKGMTDLPIGEGKARRVTVSYAKQGGGYTPGDVYEVYLNDNDMPIQWAFHEAGGEKANLICTWEGHKKLGPLHLSLDHKTADGGFRLWISNVSATLKGGKVVKPE